MLPSIESMGGAGCVFTLGLTFLEDFFLVRLGFFAILRAVAGCFRLFTVLAGRRKIVLLPATEADTGAAAFFNDDDLT